MDENFKFTELKYPNTNDEINWFNQELIRNNNKVGNIIPSSNITSKTKIVASIRKDYNQSYLKELVRAGLRIFRINGAYFNIREYEKLMKDLEEAFKDTMDQPTVIFDLKGPIPRISKVGMGKKSVIDVKKHQLIKILHENVKIEEPDIIHVDKKITQCVNVGDRILIDSSKCILTVISKERYKRRNSISKISGYKSTSHLCKVNSDLDLDIDEFLKDLEKEGTFNYIDSPIIDFNNFLPPIKEEENSFYLDDHDISIEERLINKRNTMKKAYENIINKHKNYNELNKINELERINLTLSLAEDESQSNNSCKILFINKVVKSTEDENKIYLEKRNKIKSSIASSNQNKINNMILCEVSHTSKIHLQKKLFLLGKEIVSELGTSIIGVKDIVDINSTINIGINIITALVNTSENIDEIRELAGGKVNDLIIFARIETSEAIYNFDSILDKSDGIIIQQGLLSSKIKYEDLCLIEAYMIEKCNIMQKPIFMQTCILKSMTSRVKPLISEISNIDHAVNMGIDGIILKEEITMAVKGNHNEIIKILNDMLPQVEILADTKTKYEELSKFFKLHREFAIDSNVESLIDCVVKSSFDANIGLILMYTDDCRFARTLAKFRPKCRILCLVSDIKSFNYLRLIRGVYPFLLSLDITHKEIVQLAKDRGLILFSNKILIINAYKDATYKNGFSFYDSSLC